MRVGIALPIGERGPEKRAHPYSELREMAVAAEQGGADSIWVADHCSMKRKTAACGHLGVDDRARGLADATKRVELGSARDVRAVP